MTPTGKPADGRLTVYATVASAFCRGETALALGDDFNPNTTVQLQKDRTATVRGIVTDSRGRAVAGARVSLAGYGSEAAVTQADGNFVLPAHAADGQQVQLHAERTGYRPVDQWHPAGDTPAALVLQSEAGSRRKPR